MEKKLVDKYGRSLRDLRISVIDKCNFRCPYCMPAEVFHANYKFLNNHELLSVTEITHLARLFVQLGVSKLRLTGGEPLLRPDLLDIIASLATIPGVEDIALTTNGFHLGEMAASLRQAGLHRLTVSLDSLDNEVFQVMNGRRSTVERVLEGITKAEEAGFGRIKLNCVVKKGVNDHTIAELAHAFKGTGHIVRFIEYMDVGNFNHWRLDEVITADQILRLIDLEMPLEPVPANYPGEVANRYRYLDGNGEIGVIASVSKPFCGGCTRARLSSAGEYYTCLFGHHATDLRAPLRNGASDEELLQLIGGVWGKRTDRYSELRTSFTRLPEKGAEMFRLGG